MNIVDIVTNYLSLLTLLVDLLLVALLALVGLKKIGVVTAAGRHATDFVGKHGFLIALGTALGALAGSIFYSNFAHYPPCELCWWQRIFMYPQIVLLGLGLWKKEVHRLVDYALVLTTLGLLTAAYHSLLIFGPTSNLPCPAQGGPSCGQFFFMEFGYVAIPTMSLTSFAIIFIALVFAKNYHHPAE